MKVRATQKGYYNHKRRKPGEVFLLMNAKAFSKRWMEKVEGVSVSPPAPAPEKADAPVKTSSEEVI